MTTRNYVFFHPFATSTQQLDMKLEDAVQITKYFDWKYIALQNLNQ
jgi:hypothetical protein